MKASAWRWLVLGLLAQAIGAGVSTAQTDWMQPGVRVWYLGGVGDWDMSSNAEEAYLIQSIDGATATVRHHSALTHWTVPQPVQTGTAPVLDMGPCWIHPQRLRTVHAGEYWRADQRITLVERDKTFADLQYRFLPARALQALAPQRQVVKITYKIDRNYALPTGSAWFDANTGLLLYHNSWWGGTKMFFVLAEINYDFAHGIAFPEDHGPHTGFRSFVSERSQGVWNGFTFVGGGSITIQSMVESRYGATVQTHAMPSIVPSNFGTAYWGFAFFGDVPIVRRLQYPQSMDVPPDQWPAFGHHLWWWLPRTATGALAAAPVDVPGAAGAVADAAAVPAIDVLGVPMTKTSESPLTYTATQAPATFHFSVLRFDAAGYMTEFSAREPATGLHVQPTDFNYWPCWMALQQLGRPEATGPEYCVDGRIYFRDQMALPATPAPTVSSIFPASGPTSGGTAITIQGTNFVAGATAVTVGGTLASNVVVQGPTSLTCVTPPGAAGPRDVHVIVSAVSSTAPGTFLYADAVPVTPPADPSQPVTVSVALPGGTMTATFRGVTSAGSVMAVPVGAPAPPFPQATFLPASALFVETPGLSYTSATFCFPYDEAAVAAAGLDEETLMVWHQPAGSPRWIDVTTSHDLAGHRLCARDGVSQVVVAGVRGQSLPDRRYMAEGATSDLFDTSFALANFAPDGDANVVLRFQRTDTSARVRYVAVPPRGRRTVTVADVPEMAAAEFSTLVESDRPVVVDRTMRWDATGYGAHTEASVAAPATTWYLAEGATHSGFNLFYLIQNPHPDTAAQVRVRYLLPTGAPIEKVHAVPPHSRYNIWVNHEQVPEGSGLRPLAATDVSAVLDSLNGVAVIVERAMYLDRAGQHFAAGHDSAGVTEPAVQWFLAEGATGPYFDLFVLVANPSPTDAPIEATYLLPGGATFTKPYTVAANSRFNIWVDYDDTRLVDTAVSTTIRSVAGVPIIVERAMWWAGRAWYEAHNSPGSTVTGTRWALADGEVDTSRNLETYVLVANTSPHPTDVQVTLYFEDGGTAQRTFTDVAGNSRFNVPVGVYFPEAARRRFATIVESVGASPAQLVVERAMYWDAGGQPWAAGTNALATKLQ